MIGMSNWQRSIDNATTSIKGLKNEGEMTDFVLYSLLNNVADWNVDVTSEYSIATFITYAHLGSVVEL